MKTAIQRQYESLIVRLALTLYIWRAMLLITLLCVKKKKGNGRPMADTAIGM